MDCSPPGSSVYEISQVRILEQVTISFSRGSSSEIPIIFFKKKKISTYRTQRVWHSYPKGTAERWGSTWEGAIFWGQTAWNHYWLDHVLPV